MGEKRGGSIGRALLAVLIALAVLYGCETEHASVPAKEKKRPEVDAERGMRVLWPDYKEPVEKLSWRHPQPEAQVVIRLTGDDKPVELSGFHSCAKFFDETVRPPFEARVPYCDDRWESGWVEADTRAEAEVKLEVLLDSRVWQSDTLTNKRRQDEVQYTKALSLRTPNEKHRTSRKKGE